MNATTRPGIVKHLIWGSDFLVDRVSGVKYAWER